MPSQPLTGVVSVTVQVSPVPVGPAALNTGLIVGPSPVISPAQRVVVYSSLAAMTTAGFVSTDPEYLAAEAYFGQTPTPPQVAIGRQDTDAQSSTTLSTALVDGDPYSVLDVAALTVAIETGATVTIGTGGTTQQVVTSAAATVGATSIEVVEFYANAAYAIGAAVASNTPETLLAAVQACQAASSAWYAFYECGAVDADIEAAATWALGLGAPVQHFYDTQDTAVVNAVAGNVMETLQSAKDRRSFGIWSTTAYAGAALMGEAMGLARPVTQAVLHSAATLAYKALATVAPEPLTYQQAQNVLGYGGNVYVTYGANFNWLVQGTAADGTHWDTLFEQDLLVTGMANDIANLLTSVAEVPYTDQGMAMLGNAIEAGTLSQAVNAGIIAAGTWDSAGVGTLATGTTLPQGYAVILTPIAQATTSQQSTRTAPPIYVAAIQPGAIEHVVIGIVAQI